MIKKPNDDATMTTRDCDKLRSNKKIKEKVADDSELSTLLFAARETMSKKDFHELFLLL